MFVVGCAGFYEPNAAATSRLHTVATSGFHGATSKSATQPIRLEFDVEAKTRLHLRLCIRIHIHIHIPSRSRYFRRRRK
jgi:hypothetical protein